MPHGQGQLFLSNGDIYEGMFSNGHRDEGPGKLIYATGEIYEGNFIQDLPHG